MTTPYPLAWPANVPRSAKYEKHSLKTSLNIALRNVENSLRLFAKDSGKAISELVISSNASLGRDKPTDPGVAVWFLWDGLTVSIAVDRYQAVEANLQAVHHIIEARRTELRHGTLALVRASMTGLVALPPSSAARRRWHEVLGCQADAGAGEIEMAYRNKAKKAHPDAGGSDAAMSELNSAREEGLRGRR